MKEDLLKSKRGMTMSTSGGKIIAYEECDFQIGASDHNSTANLPSTFHGSFHGKK